MLDGFRRRITYANVMSTIAVFGVLAGGGAYAASKIGSGDIKRNAVRSAHIQKSAVKAKQVQARTVKRALGISNTGPVRVKLGAVGTPDRTRALARSGPIVLVGRCGYGGPTDTTTYASLVIRSRVGGGTATGVRYPPGTAPQSFGLTLSEAGTVVTFAFGTSAATFTAIAGGRTLTGEAYAETPASDACRFNLAGFSR